MIIFTEMKNILLNKISRSAIVKVILQTTFFLDHQYIIADDVLVLQEQVEHLNCQWEELCLKVSLPGLMH